MNCRLVSRFTAAAIAAACCGCGGGSDRFKDDRPPVVPAEGTVTYQGQPLDGATVVFVPSNPDGHAGAAVSDATGRFAISTFPPDPGAVSGNYTVTVTKMNPAAANAPLPENAHDTDLVAIPPQTLIPARYSDATQSGLTAQVPPEGRTDFKFELTK
jgi:hypothetical protein